MWNGKKVLPDGFYGFKVPLGINDGGELCSFCFTPAMGMTETWMSLTICTVI
jgi:hypothetical protein